MVISRSVPSLNGYVSVVGIKKIQSKLSCSYTGSERRARLIFGLGAMKGARSKSGLFPDIASTRKLQIPFPPSYGS